jgi:tocopherol O-methyltransferase
MSLLYRVFWGDHLHHGLFLTGQESPEEAQLQLLNYCAGLAGIQPESAVLDVGCGYGATAIYLAQKFRCTVHGLTLSPKQARVARTKIADLRLLDNVQISVCDFEQMCPVCQYDLVWTLESSEHLQDKRAYVQKVAGLLRHGGKLVLAAWTGSMEVRFVRELAWRSPGFQTAVEYKAQLMDAGLHVVALKNVTPFVARTWEVCWHRVAYICRLRRFVPAEIRRFVSAIPMMIEAYRRELLSYTVIVAAKQ